MTKDELEHLIHKAKPQDDNPYCCAVCGTEIKKVPGGHGSTYVHTDTGAVAAANPEEGS